MLTLIASAALAATAQPSDAPRKAYANCLGEFVRKANKDALTQDAFDAGIKTACTTQEAAFRKSVVDYDMKTGTKRADAEDGARLQVEDYMANAREGFVAPK